MLPVRSIHEADATLPLADYFDISKNPADMLFVKRLLQLNSPSTLKKRLPWGSSA